MIRHFVLVAALLIPQPTLAQSQDEAWLAYQNRDYATALAIWRSLAETGDVDALYNIGVIFAEGRGVDADIAEALIHWRQAADAFHAEALHNVGSIYLAGDGVEQDLALAAESFRKAANLGHPRGKYALAKMMLADLVDAEPAEAFSLMIDAAKSGLVQAQHNLGKMYRDGSGTHPDEIAAVAWFQAAASQGYAPSQRNLANRLATGDSVLEDRIEALKWAILAAQYGLELAVEIETELRRILPSQAVEEAETLAAFFAAKRWDRTDGDGDS